MGFHNNPKIVTNGLVLHLDAGDRNSYVSGSSTWYDLSGNRLNATLMSGSGYSSENMGVITLDGVNDYVNVPTNFMANWTAFTFESWIYPNNTINGGVICAYNRIDADLWSGPILSITTQSISLTVYYQAGTNFISKVSSTLTNTFNNWYHVVGTWVPGNINFYINGAFVSGSIDTLGTNPSVIADNNVHTFRVGLGRITVAPISAKTSVCNVYNRALSQSEIKQNYNALKGRFGLR